jgi:hypothetical protein
MLILMLMLILFIYLVINIQFMSRVILDFYKVILFIYYDLFFMIKFTFYHGLFYHNIYYINDCLIILFQIDMNYLMIIYLDIDSI